MRRRVDWHCSVWPLRTPRRRTHRRGRRHLRTARPRTNLSPTSPRKFADVDWCSRKIKPNKICAECWPGAAFGPYWLLTERLRNETTPLLSALRDRVRVHGRRDDAQGGHRKSPAAPGNSRAAGASRRHEQRYRQGQRRHQRKCDSRYRRGQHHNIHRHQRSQPRKRRRPHRHALCFVKLI